MTLFVIAKDCGSMSGSFARKDHEYKHVTATAVLVPRPMARLSRRRRRSMMVTASASASASVYGDAFAPGSFASRRFASASLESSARRIDSGGQGTV
ncbi:hypothetical protein P5V15_002269 [Pogonomyrmex californicus]